MKIRAIIVILLFSVNKGFCQTSKSTIIYQNQLQFLYIISLNKQEPIITRNAFISPAEKDTSYGLSGSTNDELCKLLKINRVIFIKVKPNAKIVTLNKVFEIYHISNGDRKLNVKINDDLIKNPETLLISLKEIGSVNVVKNSKPYYIHIVEKGYFENKKHFDQLKKKGEIFIQ